MTPSQHIFSNSNDISSIFFSARVRVSINGDLGRYACPLHSLGSPSASRPLLASLPLVHSSSATIAISPHARRLPVTGPRLALIGFSPIVPSNFKSSIIGYNFFLRGSNWLNSICSSLYSSFSSKTISITRGEA